MTALGRLLTVAMLPAKIAHEATHALGWLPWAERISLWVEPDDGTAAVDVAYDPDRTPQCGIILAATLPMWTGIGAGGLLVAWVLATGQTPASLREWATAAIVTMWWGHYSWPSASDRRAARGSETVPQEETTHAD